jgi:predicted dehydrogenase
VSKAPLRTAIVGAGLMGRWHAQAASIAAIVDRDERAAVALRRRHPGARVATHLGDLARGIDIVHVCTPTATHSALAEEAIAAGCHVLVEKPLAYDALETSRLLSLADAAGVLLCPVHQFVFQRGMLAVLRRLTTLAPVQFVTIVICSAGAEEADAAGRARVAWEILPHALSIVVRLELGEVADWHGVAPPIAGELRVLGVAGSVTTAITISMGGRPPRNELQIVGAGGTLDADLFHGFAVSEAPVSSKARKILRPFSRAFRTLAGGGLNLARRAVMREPAYPGLVELVRRFHLAAAGRGPCPIPATETLAVARYVDAIRRAVGESRGAASR